MKKSNRIIWGVVLVLLGLFYALKALGVLVGSLFFSGWWTLFIIIPCLIGLFTDRDKFGNVFGLLLGIFLLLCCQDVLSFSLLFKLAVPIIIVIIGVKMIFGGFANRRSNALIQEMNKNGHEMKSGFAAFSGNTLNFDGEVFEGVELNAVFGGVKCDISHAIIEKDCVINANATFGGIDIILPDRVNLKIASNSLFGGVSNKRPVFVSTDAPTIYINCTCMFGGVDLK